MFQRFIEKIVFTFFALFLILAISAGGIYFSLRNDLPQLPDSLEKINLSLPTEIYSVDGEVLKVLGQRHPVPIEQISPFFTKAIIAVEDSRFYSHNGLDHLGLARALWRNLLAGGIRQGGSTITQQLSKNMFFSFERKWVRKIKELLVALQLEATFSKEEILEAYCNQVYFGSGAYGVEEAAQIYFGKRAKELTLFQAALLAGLPNSPNNSNPFKNIDRALKRAQYVLSRMYRTKFITKWEMEHAVEDELDLQPPRKDSNPNQYFVQHVIEKLEKDYGKEFVHFGGLRVFTTLDTRYQFMAAKAAENHLKVLDNLFPKDENSKNQRLQTAIVTIENKTGAIRVMLGGRKYSESQFNRATSNNRMPGSSFKPIVYLSAMENLGISPATVVKDEPSTFKIPGSPPWKPKNFNDKYSGDLILKKALMKSLNVVSAKLVYELTPRRVIETAHQMGIASRLGNNLSLALGTSGISPLELATAYSVIANLGILNEPYFIKKIEDYRGNTLFEHFFYGVQRFSPKAMYPLLDMMVGVVENGTGRNVRKLGFKHPAGGKTGTSNDYKDAWFNGFTRDLSTSVWVGYDNNSPMIDKRNRGLTGGVAAAPIWAYFMKRVLSNQTPVNFPIPEGIRMVAVDSKNGYLPSPDTKEKMEVAIKKEVIITLPPSGNDSTSSWKGNEPQITTAPIEESGVPEL